MVPQTEKNGQKGERPAGEDSRWLLWLLNLKTKTKKTGKWRTPRQRG
jgi:hypothetical protein